MLNSLEAAQLCAEAADDKKAFDVLILDLNMPGRASLEAIPNIRESSPETQIVVLTMQKEPGFAR